MALFDSIYSSTYDLVYGYKIARFRSHIQNNMKALQKEIKRKPKGLIFDLSQVKRILIIKNEAFGDMILVTPLIRHLATNGYLVDVFASEANQCIIAHNPFVNEIIAQTGGPENANNYVLEHMKDRHYDLVLDVRYPIYYEDLNRLLFPQHISCDYLVGWNRSNIGIYDKSLDFYDDHGHFSDVIATFLQFMGIESTDLAYDLYIEQEAKENTRNYMRDLWRQGGPVVVFNPFSSHPSRDLNTVQIQNMVDMILENYPFAQIVFIGQPGKIDSISINPLQETHIQRYASPSIMDVVPLIEYADIVISPDTAIVHIAAAFHKPTIGLYISAIRTATNGKETAKRDYYQQMQLLKDRFFDEPRLIAGIRAERSLLNDYMFAPNNDRAEQLFSSTGNMSDLSCHLMMGMFSKLLSRYVRDPMYIAPQRLILEYQPQEVRFDHSASTSKNKPVDADAQTIDIVEESTKEKDK